MAGRANASVKKVAASQRADFTAHGDREMPVWGRWFKEESAQDLGGAEGDEATVKRRVDNVVNYIATLQVK